MPNIRRLGFIFFSALILCCSAVSPGVRSQEPAGRGFFASEIEFGGAKFLRNGLGRRSILFIDACSGALYLTRQTGDTATILSAKTRSVVRLRIHGDPPDIPENWRESLKAELSYKMYNRVKEKFKDVEAGDSDQIGYIPGRGTTVILNGVRIVRDAGFGLMEAFLEQWLGKKPVSDSLKTALLGAN